MRENIELRVAHTRAQTDQVLAAVRKISKPRQLQVPSEALRRSPTDDAVSADRAPLLELLGHGGEVRFKMYLWLRWYSQHSRNSEPTPMRLSHLQWALLLALPKPKTNGVKRVSTAIAQLEDRKLLNRTARRPADATPVSVPWWPLDRDQPSTGYAALPVNFFTGQWIGGLSGRALAALLILIDRANPRISMPTETLGPPTYVAESILTNTYGVSEDLYRPGRQELETAKIVKSHLNKTWSGQDSDWSGMESTVNVATLREAAHPRFAAKPKTLWP